MGSSRATLASASVTPTLMQTHSPSGSSSSTTPISGMNCSIKTEPSANMDAAMDAQCHPETWAESYQDLSSWCSATLASSPAICPLPVTDEVLTGDVDFQGEIDFDLRKSEEIASIPLEEDYSFNLWGSSSLSLGDTSSPLLVSADNSTDTSDSVLLKDCWWYKPELKKGEKDLKLDRPQTLNTTSSSSLRSHLGSQIPSFSVKGEEVEVKEEVTEITENMNPTVEQPQSLLTDPIKMEELLMRLERIVSRRQPGVNSKTKAADLMKILQEQMKLSNKKKLQSPAAVSDLHNYHSKVRQVAPSTSTSAVTVTSAPVTLGNANDIFYSDPFDGLFPTTEVLTNQVNQVIGPESSIGNMQPHQTFPANQNMLPSIASNVSHITTNEPLIQQSTSGAAVIRDPRNTDHFTEAHHRIMREASKHQPSPSLNLHQNSLASQSSAPTSQQHASSTEKNENKLTIQLPNPRVNVPEMDLLNIDALLFGSGGSVAGCNKISAISTPEVLKPLVETPDPESFDLLSYLFDDKMSTPPVCLENNPFQFPQPSSSQSSAAGVTVTEHKPNVMIVKPLTPPIQPVIVKKEHDRKDSSESEFAQATQVKLQKKLPAVLSDVEEDIEDEASISKSVAEPIKEERVLSRPVRSPRKRKYSDEFVFSPSPSEESIKSSRRRRTTSSKYDSDEEFTIPVRKARKRHILPVDEDSDDSTKKKRSRASPSVKRKERTVSTSSESDRYRELRDRNNEASRKSRLTRKAREQELGKQAEMLTKENRVLKVKVEEMENLVKKLREALLQSMMKKS